jgi:putative ABC transport system permease protein
MMIVSYGKIAWRNLNKHRLFSLVNICGLAIGMAAFWLIVLYVTDELSFDRYNKNASRIFRIAQHGKWGNGSFDLPITSAPYAAALKADYPGVEAATRIDPEGGGKIIYGDKQIQAPYIVVADNSIFDIFTYPFLEGDQKDALSKPHSIVLTRSLAVRLFGNIASATGATIYFDNNNDPVLVTGVIEDVPANSHFTFTAIRSFNTTETGHWANANLFTYVLLKDAKDAGNIEAHSQAFYDKYLKTELAGIKYHMELQPLTSIHLHSHMQFEFADNGNIRYIYVFCIVALLVLGIAVINYINLTTARASTRVKEIGIRKVIGSDRRQLLYLFFSESILCCVLATALALLLVKAALPMFNELSGKSLDIAYFGKWTSILLFGGSALALGLLSGIYPALFLSGFRTIPAMKGQLGSQTATVLFRKSLVTFQFAITIIMIAGSCVIYRQLHFVLNKDLGFNKSEMLSFHLYGKAARTQLDAMKARLLQNPLVKSVAAAGNPIGNNDIGETDFNIGADGKTSPDTKVVEQLIIDEDFIPAMDIRMDQGRNFIKGAADSARHAIIINRTLADASGWKNPVGMQVRTGVENGVVQWSTIVGVVRDFNTYSLQHKIQPMELVLPQTANDKDNVYVRLSGRDIPTAIRYLQRVYREFDPANQLDYRFLDQNFAKQYQTEQKQGSLLLIFTILAISIASLGLFGLVTFTAEQRVKEIGIRKVLGASVPHIVGLLTRELMLLVGLATLIATPIGWYAMRQWLQSFAYRVGIDWWIFAGAGVTAALVAFVTMSIRSIRAANANPAKSLKTE